QAEDGIRDKLVTGVQTCALPISNALRNSLRAGKSGIRRFEAALRGERRIDPRGEQELVGGIGAVQAVGAQALVGDGVEADQAGRSEERRVGKEGRARGRAWHEKE